MSSRSSAYNQGWDTTSPGYHTHVSSVERSESAQTDIPHYPNVFKLFNNRATHEEKKTEQQQHQEEHEGGKKQGNRRSHLNQSPEPPKKVHFEKKPVEEKKEKIKAHEDEDDFSRFIQQKHKNFELCKWETFKV